MDSSLWHKARTTLGRTFHIPHAHKLEALLKGLSVSEKLFAGMLVAAFAGSAFWMLAVINGNLMTEMPVRGGSLSEGIVGSVRFVNPLLAISDADKDLATLVYSGLMRKTSTGELVSDLADHYEVSADGLTYTFVIRDDAAFQDGTPVTADDVVFTVKRAQDPALKSPKLANWDGVEASATDAHTVQFTLKQPYAPFIENATLGILPAHLWKDVPVEEMPFSNLNINPVGSGPFRITHVKENSSGIPVSFTLSPFDRSTRPPYLERVTVTLYPSDEAAIAALQKGDIDALHSVDPGELTSSQKSSEHAYEAVLSRIFGVFFNQNKNDAFADIHVRKALDEALDKDAIVQSVLSGYGRAVDGPVPPQGGATSTANAPAQEARLAQAKAELQKGGWTQTSSGLWQKKTGTGKSAKSKQLSVTISTASIPELKAAAEMVKNQWEDLGVPTTVQLYEQSDLNQNVIRPREYQALLFGLSVGSSPDLFAFWHSSQRNDPGLNIAMYTSISADKQLAQARTASVEEERAKFTAQAATTIENDAPAAFLYSPEFVYVLPAGIKGADFAIIDAPSDRFNDIASWYVYTESVWKIFSKQ